MKKLILFISIVALSSCKSDDELKHPNIAGNWEMVTYSGFLPENPTINKGDVIWNINSNNIIMTNNSEYDFLSNEGTFSYSWVNERIIRVKYSNEIDLYYKVSVKDQVLQLMETVKPGDSEMTDLAVLTFEK